MSRCVNIMGRETCLDGIAWFFESGIVRLRVLVGKWSAVEVGRQAVCNRETVKSFVKGALEWC